MEQKKHNSKKIVVLIIATVLIIAGIIITGLIIYSNTPAKRYEKQISLGDNYLDDEKYEKAIEAFTKAIDIDKLQVDAYISLAKAYYKSGDSDEALEVLQEAKLVMEDEYDEDDAFTEDEYEEIQKKLDKAIQKYEPELDEGELPEAKPTPTRMPTPTDTILYSTPTATPTPTNTPTPTVTPTPIDTAQVDIEPFVEEQHYYVQSTNEYQLKIYKEYVEIELYLGYEPIVNIPSEYDGLPIRVIGKYAFRECSSLTDVIIPDSVVMIKDEAFNNCEKLTMISIPDSVTYIGFKAFEATPWLDSFTVDYVIINDGILIDYNGTGGDVTIPSGVKQVSGFFGNTDITGITIPDTVTSIGYSAFYECTNLKSITIPHSVTSIGGWAFACCSMLESITLPDSITSIEYYAFYNCSYLTDVTLPDSLSSIGYWAFAYCSYLANISIPDSVTSIGVKAFYETAWLNAFTDEYVVINDGILVEYVGTGGDITIPSNVKHVSAFDFNDIITSVILPDSVISIDENAFCYCTELVEIAIPESVTSIKNSAFEGCSNLSVITIPDSVTSIGHHVFRDCSSLTAITISENVTYFGDGIFDYCDELIIFVVPGSIAEQYCIDNQYQYEYSE